MIKVLWKGVEAVLSLDAGRRWVGPPDLTPQLDAAFGADAYPDAAAQLAAVAARLGGTIVTPETEAAPDGSA